MSAIKLARNPVFHARIKHIELHHHFIRERILAKELSVSFVRSEDQTADILTKALSLILFSGHREALRIISLAKISE
jgi:hypothetical protein